MLRQKRSTVIANFSEEKDPNSFNDFRNSSVRTLQNCPPIGITSLDFYKYFDF